MKNGIDVSRHQLTIDWTAVKNSGIEFAIIKAGGSDDGFYEDSTFQRNYAGAKGAGLAVGAYYIVGSKCISREDGIADAKRFLKIIEVPSALLFPAIIMSCIIYRKKTIQIFFF